MANQGIVQSIITLGKSLNMSIVAECVGNCRTARHPQSNGMRHYSRLLFLVNPLHPDDAEKALTPKANVTRFVRK